MISCKQELLVTGCLLVRRDVFINVFVIVESLTKSVFVNDVACPKIKIPAVVRCRYYHLILI